MATYAISGIWKVDGVIQAYAVHLKTSNNAYEGGVRMSKEEVIDLIQHGHVVYTWLWNYSARDWRRGEDVGVVRDGVNTYLRSNPDHSTRDNLGHLLNYDWI